MNTSEVAITEERLAEIRGIGSKTAEDLTERLEEEGLMNFRQLKEAVENDEILEVNGVGPSTQEDIRQYLEQNSARLLPEEEPEELARREKPWVLNTFWAWLIITITMLGVGIGVPWFFFGTYASWGVVGGSVFLTGLWANKCWPQVGTEKKPAQGVLTEFFDPIDVVGIGRYFIFWPVERIKRFPTGEYEMSFFVPVVYTKESDDEDEDDDGSSQPMEVNVTIYTHFPDRNRQYKYPMPKEEAKRRGVNFDPIEGDYTNRENWVWGRISGKELLMKAYRRLRISDLTAEGTVDELGSFLKGGVGGAIRGVFQSFTTKQINEKTDLIETEVKDYLLVEEGNPMFETGFPREHTDVEVDVSVLDEDLVQAKKEVEIASHEEEAAEHRKQAKKKELQAYTEEDTPIELAAMRVGGGAGTGGEAMSISEIRDLGLVKLFGTFDDASDIQNASHEKLIEELKKLSTEELKEIFDQVI